MKSLVSTRDGLNLLSRSGTGASESAETGVRVRTLRKSIVLAASSLLGVLAATACGAGGADGDLIQRQGSQTSGEGGAAGRGGGTGGSSQPSNLTICTDIACQNEGGEVPIPPGCGDGNLAEDEACDDGNTVSGDGCSAQCLIAEPGFSCAEPGRACRRIARCGDALVAPTEQCDDGNLETGDGCSDRCRVELGKKCSGEPSFCDDAICGNGVKEGAEACDDGNTDPFDGCSPLCLKEPNCEGGGACSSECGDGLLIDEQCDDGNLIDGDGCSSSCTVEGGFTCEEVAVCEEINGQCVIRVPAVFRDFSSNHPDFQNNAACEDLAPGALGLLLDANSRPQLSGNAALQNAACMSTPANFADWYTDNASNVKIPGELLLFDNGQGGYVNRYGAGGEPFSAVDADTELNTGSQTLAGCEAACVNRARDGQPPFQGQGNLRCNDQALCGGLRDSVQQLRNGQLGQAAQAVAQAQNAQQPDLEEIADLEAALAVIQARVDVLDEQATTCQTECETELEERIESCSVTCKPCGAGPGQFCIGGEFLTFDGNPLFFPVDGQPGQTDTGVIATIPEQYGYANYPLETDIFPNATPHNFYFTSEVQYWFQYTANTRATLEFLGDDDVWVYLNGRLAVDLGGVHVPSDGTVTIDAAANIVNTTIADGRLEAGERTGIVRADTGTPADYGLEEGGVYTITIFHAERQVNGSSFKLTLAGFEATPSQCTAICGDNILSFGEECDDGENDGGYNECGANCILGPFCGDGIVQGGSGESCDDGPGGSDLCRGCRKVEAPL